MAFVIAELYWSQRHGIGRRPCGLAGGIAGFGSVVRRNFTEPRGEALTQVWLYAFVYGLRSWIDCRFSAATSAGSLIVVRNDCDCVRSSAWHDWQSQILPVAAPCRTLIRGG